MHQDPFVIEVNPHIRNAVLLPNWRTTLVQLGSAHRTFFCPPPLVPLGQVKHNPSLPQTGDEER